MPELPEVQTVRDALKKSVLNKKIENINIIYPNIIENDLDEFKSKLIGEAFIDIKRRGKYLIFETKKNYMVSHLRMEGKYFVKDKNDKIEKHEHITFEFKDFSLRYHDTRKFGRMKVINKDEIENYINVGPDANLCDDVNYLYNKINNKNIPIKTLLLDQSILAGLGNIYVDEVLFASKINPNRVGSNVSFDDCKNILKFSKLILNKAIEEKGCTIRSYTSQLGVIGNYQKYLKVHTKQACCCGNDITLCRIGGRSTYYCNICQK